MSDKPKLELDDTAICRGCTEGLVVRSVRTGRFWSGPFWRLAWTHADPQPGTDGQRCWAPPPDPDPSTFRRSIDYERPASLTGAVWGIPPAVDDGFPGDLPVGHPDRPADV